MQPLQPEPSRESSSKPSYISSNGIAVIKHYEGCRLLAYKDPGGVWTIGWGHTGPDVVPGMVITQNQADQWLQIRLSTEFVPGVLAAITEPVNQHQFDACVSLSYNIGVSAFAGSTLVRLLNAGEVAGAANEFPRWHLDNGKSLKGLRRRRAAERELFLGADAEAAIAIGDMHD